MLQSPAGLEQELYNLNLSDLNFLDRCRALVEKYQKTPLIVLWFFWPIIKNGKNLIPSQIRFLESFITRQKSNEFNCLLRQVVNELRDNSENRGESVKINYFNLVSVLMFYMHEPSKFEQRLKYLYNTMNPKEIIIAVLQDLLKVAVNTSATKGLYLLFWELGLHCILDRQKLLDIFHDTAGAGGYKPELCLDFYIKMIKANITDISLQKINLELAPWLIFLIDKINTFFAPFENKQGYENKLEVMQRYRITDERNILLFTDLYKISQLFLHVNDRLYQKLLQLQMAVVNRENFVAIICKLFIVVGTSFLTIDEKKKQLKDIIKKIPRELLCSQQSEERIAKVRDFFEKFEHIRISESDRKKLIDFYRHLDQRDKEDFAIIFAMEDYISCLNIDKDEESEDVVGTEVRRPYRYRRSFISHKGSAAAASRDTANFPRRAGGIGASIDNGGKTRQVFQPSSSPAGKIRIPKKRKRDDPPAKPREAERMTSRSDILLPGQSRAVRGSNNSGTAESERKFAEVVLGDDSDDYVDPFSITYSPAAFFKSDAKAKKSTSSHQSRSSTTQKKFPDGNAAAAAAGAVATSHPSGTKSRGAGSRGENIENKKITKQQKLQRLLERSLPDGFMIGRAKGDGDCFFDAVAQALNQQKGREVYTIESLRRLCSDYANALEKEHPVLVVKPSEEDIKANWIFQACGKRFDLYQKYLMQGKFTAEEAEFLREECKIEDGLAVWGEQEIDGVIICKKFGIEIHVVELHEEFLDQSGALPPLLHQLITAQGTRQLEMCETELYAQSTLIHISVGRIHFRPILRGERSVALSQPPVLEETQIQHNSMMPMGLWGEAACFSLLRQKYAAKYEFEFLDELEGKLRLYSTAAVDDDKETKGASHAAKYSFVEVEWFNKKAWEEWARTKDKKHLDTTDHRPYDIVVRKGDGSAIKKERFIEVKSTIHNVPSVVNLTGREFDFMRANNAAYRLIRCYAALSPDCNVEVFKDCYGKISRGEIGISGLICRL